MARSRNGSRPTPTNGRLADATRGGHVLRKPAKGTQPDAVMVDALVNADLAGAIRLAQGFVLTPEGKAGVLAENGQIMIPGDDQSRQMLVNAIGVCVEAAKHYAIANQPNPDEEE